MIGWFTVAAALCAAATVVPLWIGLRRIERFEVLAYKGEVEPRQDIERGIIGEHEPSPRETA